MGYTDIRFPPAPVLGQDDEPDPLAVAGGILWAEWSERAADLIPGVLEITSAQAAFGAGVSPAEYAAQIVTVWTGARIGWQGPRSRAAGAGRF